MIKDEKKGNIILIGLVFIIIILILIIPGLLALFLNFKIFSAAPGQVESWIGFWGSFLGGIVGMIAVVLTTFFLIGNQNKLHFELLAEQRKSIDNAAELNDKKTREREHKLFLLNKNEKLIDLFVSLMKFIKLRNEILRKIFNIGTEISNLNKFQEMLGERIEDFGKEDSMHNVVISLISDNKVNIFRESELFAELEIQISEIKMLYALLEYDLNEVDEFKDSLVENEHYMVEKINNKMFDKSYLKKINDFDSESADLLNRIIIKHVSNHKLLFEDYKK